MARVPIPSAWFRRLLIKARCVGTIGAVPAPASVGLLGFTVRFPGSTPRDAGRWLRAHGYVYGSGRAWCRVDRKESRMSRSESDVHADAVRARRRRAGIASCPDCGSNQHANC